MIEEGVEHDTHTLPTADKTESIERLYKENEDVSWQSCSQDNENGEKEARHDFEWDFKDCILEEKGFHGVYPIIEFAIEQLCALVEVYKRMGRIIPFVHEDKEPRFEATRQNTALSRLKLVNGGLRRRSWVSLTHLLLNEAKSALDVLIIRLQRCPKQRYDDGKSKYLRNSSIDNDRTASITRDATSKKNRKCNV